MAKKMCTKCQRTMEDTKFYTYKNGQKWDMCKDCLTMHVDNFNPETFTWILEKADFPYVPAEWNAIRDKQFAKKGDKMTGTSVLGKYLSRIRLNQFKGCGWADSERLQAQAQKKLALKEEQKAEVEKQAKEQFEKGQITESQYKTLTSSQYQKEHKYLEEKKTKKEDAVGADNAFRQQFFISEQDLPDPAADLTLEDKQYLAMKWGRNYRPNQWITLQTKYTEMMNSFDIQDADSKNTLMFICKTYLKMDEAIDIGDIESYQKLSRVYDSLRKSMKVTAAQKKQEEHQIVDSVGQLVAFCQKNGHKIPPFDISIPFDKVDEIITDFKNYNKELIYQDTALARQIQDYIKQARASAAKKKDEEKAKEKGLDYVQLSDEDILDFKEFMTNEYSESLEEMGVKNKDEFK